MKQGQEKNNTSENEQRRSAEWFEQGVLVSKVSGNRLYEVWSNGIFQCSAPNGERWNSGNDATDWLVERGITNDQELMDIVFEEKDGWQYTHSKWFELIVFHFTEVDGMKHCSVMYSGDIDFEYDEETFNAWIDEAIEKDNEEE